MKIEDLIDLSFIKIIGSDTLWFPLPPLGIQNTQ